MAEFWRVAKAWCRSWLSASHIRRIWSTSIAVAGLDVLAVGDEILHIGSRTRHAAFHRPVEDGPLGAMLDKAPPRSNRFGSPLVLSRVHWVRPELVVEVKYLTWTEDNLLRQVVYEGQREDKDPTEVQRPVPNQPSR
jgi:hypothetical protein